MPIYEYKSQSGKIIEKFFKMKDDKPEILIEDGIEYQRIYSVPMGIVDLSKPKTVASLAEKNTEKMIKTGKIIPKKKKNPWWRNKSKIDFDLAKMSQKQKRKYIQTGKK